MVGKQQDPVKWGTVKMMQRCRDMRIHIQHAGSDQEAVETGDLLSAKIAQESNRG